jgi:hypothetical protein
MSFMDSIAEAITPHAINTPTKPSPDSDAVIGVTHPGAAGFGFFNKMIDAVSAMDRSKFLEEVRKMSLDGPLADKVLERLVADAASTPVLIDAKPRRKKIVQDMLKQIKYEEIREELIYLMLRDGDLFLQKMHAPSIDPRRIGFIEGIVRMPTETMIRNTNERDQFVNDNVAFIQVDNIRNYVASHRKIPFTYAKMLHARVDSTKSPFFRYGRSVWISGVKNYQMAMLMLEDSVVQRHQNTQNVIWHRVGAGSDMRVNKTFIRQYAQEVASQYDEETTQMFIDGRTEFHETGGTKKVMGNVDDIMLILSILAVALDYPLDLLSVGVSHDSGGEELFRKENVLKRTIEKIIKRENEQILRPLIDQELTLAGVGSGDYRIVTQPASFEDKNKRSKRGILEVQGKVKSFQTYHEENSPELSFEEEQRRLETQFEWENEMAVKYPKSSAAQNIMTQASPSSGETGATRDADSQQERNTPGAKGTEDQ